MSTHHTSASALLHAKHGDTILVGKQAFTVSVHEGNMLSLDGYREPGTKTDSALLKRFVTEKISTGDLIVDEEAVDDLLEIVEELDASYAESHVRSAVAGRFGEALLSREDAVMVVANNTYVIW